MSTLWLVRHLATGAHPARLVGSTDLPLAVPAQAEDLAARLGPGIRPRTRVVCSDLRRAVETARPLAHQLQSDLHLTQALREMDFGAWEGLTWDEVAEQDPERHAAWFAAWETTRAPGGESLADVRARVQAWWREEEAGPAPPTDDLVIVAHATPLRVLAEHISGESIDVLLTRALPRGGWWTLRRGAADATERST